MEYVNVNLSFNGRQIKMLFDASSPVQQSILDQLSNNGTYERETQLLLMRVLGDGNTFLDIGAHIGYFTLLASAAVGNSGKVIAVEPIDENYKQLENHININALENIETIQVVVGSVDGKTQIYFNADNDGGHALWDPGKHPANQLTRDHPRADTVQSVTLGTLLERYGVDRARLIKIDTEGAEILILGAARSVFIEKRVDFVIMEVNVSGLGLLGSSIDDLFSLVNELGYDVYLPHPDAERPIPLTDENRPNPRYVYNVLMARPETLDEEWG